jgi:hypothetical protein
MPRDLSRGKQPSGRPALEPRAPDNRILLLPVLVAVVLNLPCLGLGYFWDDFYFLFSQGHGGLWAHLLPDPQRTFYRPIPLGVYFGFLRALDPVSGLLGHALNLVALVVTVVLLVTLASRLCGPRAGLFSGLIFASYGPVPGLVAWTSGSQDLFAILFVTAAFLLRHRGKDLAALACATAALLCKEPAIAAFPVLVLWDRIVGRTPQRPWLQWLAYASVALIWACVHPGVHLLAGHGFRSGSTMYVGIEHPERWGLYVFRYVLTLVNLPPPRVDAPWWEDRAVYGFAALAILIVGLGYLDRTKRPGGATGSLSLPRVGWIGGLFALPSLLMPALLVRHWAPYFACLPALGVSILLGAAVARHGRLAAIAALGTFLLFGMWCRGVRGESEWILSEPAMVEASAAVRAVRANFEKEFPTFPKGSQVVVSFGTTGIRGIQSALIDGQALASWYRDPTLRTVRTKDRRPGAAAEYLVRITDDLDVIAVDPDAMRIRSATRPSPDLAEIHRPVINYARAVAASGDTDRAIRILRGLNRIEPAELGVFNDRMIASILLAAGRRGEADSIMAATAPFPQEVALQLVQGLLAEASTSEKLDDALFPAFGLSDADPRTIRSIMLGFEKNGAMEQAAWFAQRLERLLPGDGGGAEILRTAAQMGITPQREPSLHLATPQADGS